MCGSKEEDFPEIEITSKMIEADVDALRLMDWEVDSREEIVKAILVGSMRKRCRD